MGDIIERFIWGIIYIIVNTIIFLGSPLLTILDLTIIPMADDLHQLLVFIVAIPTLILFFYASYLSKLCADNKVFSEMTLWNSHVAARGTLNLYLSYIPIIGKIFKIKSE